MRREAAQALYDEIVGGRFVLAPWQADMLAKLADRPGAQILTTPRQHGASSRIPPGITLLTSTKLEDSP